MKPFILSLLLLAAFPAQSAIDTIQTRSKISAVTIFFSGAQVTRSVELRASRGKHIVLIDKLPQEINAQSIQVASVSNCKILSVKHLNEQKRASAKGASEKEIDSKIKAQELRIKALKNRVHVFEMEERILLDNSLLSKKDEGTTVARIKEAGDFYRLRLNEIKQGKLDLSEELDAANLRIQELYVQMNETVAKKRKSYSQILISVDCERDIATDLKLSYYITSAGWEPTYDFRVEDISKPFTVVYNANVYQSSGEEWNNVNIKLSTNDPTLSADKPELQPWLVGNRNTYPTQPARPGIGSIKGSVLDAATGLPLPNANVELLRGQEIIASIISDHNGNFTVKPVLAGYYMVRISYVGYNQISMQGVQVNAGQVTIQDFRMNASQIAMQDVELQTFHPSPQNQVPVYDSYSGASGGYQPSIANAAPAQLSYAEAPVRNYRFSKAKAPKAKTEYESTDYISNSLKPTITNLEYVIDIPYTIPSDGQDYSLRIKETSVPARFVYHAVPKIDDDVFLSAEVADWAQLNLLSGKASVYFEGTFTGQSYINAEEAEDTMSISIGRDKDIIVKREGNKSLNDKRLIGSNVKETVGWDITVRNNKKSLIRITIEDQYPVSERKSIEVELLESSGAKVEEKTGKLTWELDIEPGQKKTVTNKFSVKYPKEISMLVE